MWIVGTNYATTGLESCAQNMASLLGKFILKCNFYGVLIQSDISLKMMIRKVIEHIRVRMTAYTCYCMSGSNKLGW